MSDDPFWAKALGWAWGNWDLIRTRLSLVYGWFRRDKGEAASGPGILLIGPGGVGKTTLARLLSGEYVTRLFEEPWRYDESVSEERYKVSGGPAVEVVVPPGQPSRREATWADVRADLAAGKYRGVILVTAYGYHSLAAAGGYKHHPLYQGDKEQFLADYLRHHREDELTVLRHLRPAMESAPGKLWLLVVVAKQDLWWSDRAAATAHYSADPWRAEVAAVQKARGAKGFRAEFTPVCLVISNLTTSEGESLKRNTEGYDQKLQVQSLHRLLEVADGLREWEG